MPFALPAPVRAALDVLLASVDQRVELAIALANLELLAADASPEEQAAVWVEVLSHDPPALRSAWERAAATLEKLGRVDALPSIERRASAGLHAQALRALRDRHAGRDACPCDVHRARGAAPGPTMRIDAHTEDTARWTERFECTCEVCGRRFALALEHRDMGPPAAVWRVL